MRKAVLTAANVNDTEVADYLVCGDEEAVYGDRAYSTRARSERLRGMGIKDRIMRRANKHHAKLERWEKRRNELIAPRRAPVEKVFGTLQRSYGYWRVSYVGLARNMTAMLLKLTAYNLRRADRMLLDRV